MTISSDDLKLFKESLTTEHPHLILALHGKSIKDIRSSNASQLQINDFLSPQKATLFPICQAFDIGQKSLFIGDEKAEETFNFMLGENRLNFLLRLAKNEQRTYLIALLEGELKAKDSSFLKNLYELDDQFFADQTASNELYQTLTDENYDIDAKIFNPDDKEKFNKYLLENALFKLQLPNLNRELLLKHKDQILANTNHRDDLKNIDYVNHFIQQEEQKLNKKIPSAPLQEPSILEPGNTLITNSEKKNEEKVNPKPTLHKEEFIQEMKQLSKTIYDEYCHYENGVDDKKTNAIKYLQEKLNFPITTEEEGLLEFDRHLKTLQKHAIHLRENRDSLLKNTKHQFYTGTSEGRYQIAINEYRSKAQLLHEEKDLATIAVKCDLLKRQLLFALALIENSNQDIKQKETKFTQAAVIRYINDYLYELALLQNYVSQKKDEYIAYYSEFSRVLDKNVMCTEDDATPHYKKLISDFLEYGEFDLQHVHSQTALSQVRDDHRSETKNFNENTIRVNASTLKPETGFLKSKKPVRYAAVQEKNNEGLFTRIFLSSQKPSKNQCYEIAFNEILNFIAKMETHKPIFVHQLQPAMLSKALLLAAQNLPILIGKKISVVNITGLKQPTAKESQDFVNWVLAKDPQLIQMIKPEFRLQPGKEHQNRRVMRA